MLSISSDVVLTIFFSKEMGHHIWLFQNIQIIIRKMMRSHKPVMFYDEVISAEINFV